MIKVANHCNLSFEAVEWLDGELLGDGHLEKRSTFSARFMSTTKYLEYVHYVRDTLKAFGIEQSGRIIERHPKNFGDVVYTYCSRNYIELLPFRMNWYPEGKKVIPRGVKLSPLTCRQWYIGDGSLCYKGRKNPCITLCTDAFPVYDVEWLVKQLQELGFSVTRQLARNRIYIAVCSTKDFLDYIGECPVRCYEYKWKGGE